MSEAFVQLPADGTGKLVDMQTVTNPSTGATQYRQTVTIGDPSQAGGVAEVSNGSLSVSDAPNSEGEEGDELLKLVLVELRILNHLIASEFRVRDDPAALRSDPTFSVT
jgi:hypothetical protein